MKKEDINYNNVTSFRTRPRFKVRLGWKSIILIMQLRTLINLFEDVGEPKEIDSIDYSVEGKR